MENKIKEYENRIEFLEKKVSDLEKYNAGLREILLKNIEFSTKLSNITYEMDCLLVKRGHEIRELEKKIEESLARATACESSSKLTDFDIDMTFEDHDENDSTAHGPSVNDYVEIFAHTKVDLKKDSNGYFNCSECGYKTSNSSNFENHHRCHSDEKPFGCKLCRKRYRSKWACMEHIRVHDDRFKLECTVCNAKFIKSGTIIKHCKIMHGGRGYERKRRERHRF